MPRGIIPNKSKTLAQFLKKNTYLIDCGQTVIENIARKNCFFFQLHDYDLEGPGIIFLKKKEKKHVDCD